MSAGVTVRRATSPADRDAFLRMPWKVYANDPQWVPPLVSMRKDKMNPESSPLYDYLDVDYFVAWRGDEPVGCIAPFINPQHNEYYNENIGWFGLFDVMDDPEAARALLQAAEEWVLAKGGDAIRGPASFNDLDEFGLKVDYFDSPHVIFYPYNPEYYKTFIEDAGYEGVMDMLSYQIPAESMRGENAPEKIRRVLEKQKKRRNITLRMPDLNNFDDELRIVYDMYKNAWKENWGFVPPSFAEIKHLFGQMKMFLEPEYIFIAYVEDEPAGFVVLLPDLNQAIGPAKPRPGVPEWFTLLRVLWEWKVRRKVNRTRVPFLGVVDKFQGMGIDAMLYMEVVEPALKHGLTQGDFGWVLDNNLAMNQIRDLIPSETYNRFRMYNKALK